MSQRGCRATEEGAYARVRGGVWGHWVRRITHMLVAIVPPVYYDVLPLWGPPGSRIEIWVVLVAAAGLLGFEAWRLRNRVVVWGQRPYEAQRISGAAWTIGTSIVVLLAGEALEHEAARAVAYPAFVTAGLADPVMGELRRLGYPRLARAAGVVVALAAWFAAWAWLGVPLIAAAVIPVLTPLVEGPQVRPVDDNFTLLLVPWLGGIAAYELTSLL